LIKTYGPGVVSATGAIHPALGAITGLASTLANKAIGGKMYS
jgi:hypothetical protein